MQNDDSDEDEYDEEVELEEVEEKKQSSESEEAESDPEEEEIARPKKSVGFSKHKRDLKKQEKEVRKETKGRLIRNNVEEEVSPAVPAESAEEDDEEDYF